MFDLVLAGGRVVDGTGSPWFRADVGVRGDRIAAVGALGRAEARQRVDVGGRVVAPGFVDMHVHADLALLADPYHEAAIRQGVTTYLLGQDGVAMAPASAATLAYMRRYTAGFSGRHDLPDTWSSVAEYLARFDRRVALNVAHLVPNGNVRAEVLGLESRRATADELTRMRAVIRRGLEDGAVGVSSGLDYIPSRYADTEELIALCRELGPAGGVYVTHMRGYAPETVLDSMAEVFRIGREAAIPVHISHFNSRADLVLPRLDAARDRGIDATFDLYPYLAGSTILGMIVLPPWVQEGGPEPTLSRLADPAIRKRLLTEGGDGPRGPIDDVRLAYVEAPAYRSYEGLTLADGARAAGKGAGPAGVMDFACDVLLASALAVGCVVPHRGRGEVDVRALMRHPAMLGGSDGIFAGDHPHPRGYGCFARYLGPYVRDTLAWTLEEAVEHLAGQPARRLGLADRGLIREGLAADLVVFDPARIVDRATYERGRELAIGMEHVLVNGDPVLLHGERTKALPGRALRR
ncbi:MAG TPA: D-aminoacylase [Methylomirabilota bacterium]|nr:D-aminoacylase [Methylomirabilota bacterium]